MLADEGHPLCPLIVWNDRRVDPLENYLEEWGKSLGLAQAPGVTGLSPEFLPAKWLWLRQYSFDVVARTRRLMAVTDYVVFSPSGRAVVDASSTGLTGTYAVEAGDWWEEGLRESGIERRLLSDVVLSGTLIGVTTESASMRLGQPIGISVVAGGFDHHLAAIGFGLGTVADASISTGTVLAALA